MEDSYHWAGDGTGGVGIRTTHLYPQKFSLVRDTYDGGFISSHHERTDYSFGVGDGKFGVGTRTTHLISQIFDCWVDGGNFVLYHSRNYSFMSHSYNDRAYASSIIRRWD